MKAILPTNRDRPLFLTDFTIDPESHRESINYFHWAVMLRAIRLSLCTCIQAITETGKVQYIDIVTKYVTEDDH